MSHSRQIEPVVLDFLPVDLSGLRILDVGIGHGLWAFILRSRKKGRPHITGVEPYPLYIEWAKRAGLYDSLYQGRAQDYLRDNPDARYDYILCCEVVEHHENKKEALQLLLDLYDRLLPDGRLIVSTPLGFGGKGLGSEGNPLNAHQIGFSPRDFRRQGFKMEAVPCEGSLYRLGHVVGPIARAWFTVRRMRFPVTCSIVAWRTRV